MCSNCRSIGASRRTSKRDIKSSHYRPRVTHVPRARVDITEPSVILRRTSSTSEQTVAKLKATSPSVAKSGCLVAASVVDGATIAAAMVAARANLLIAKRIDDPAPWDQFVRKSFQDRSDWTLQLNRCFGQPVTMHKPSRTSGAGPHLLFVNRSTPETAALIHLAAFPITPLDPQAPRHRGGSRTTRWRRASAPAVPWCTPIRLLTRLAFAKDQP